MPCWVTGASTITNSTPICNHLSRGSSPIEQEEGMVIHVSFFLGLHNYTYIGYYNRYNLLASEIALFISTGKLLRKRSAVLITYVAAIWEIRSAKFARAWWRMPGTTRAKRKNVWTTLLKEARSMIPESKNEMVRLQATRSMVGSQCFARSARKLFMGSVLEKLVFGDENRLRVVNVVAVMRYKQYTEKMNETRLSSRPYAVCARCCV
ncbi:unnamed protein product [Periconia digitata]|uniref:Uncharacterized protein n=1 Tax=Periconia digitata TaxID=1303443 RepID=A0A9W4UPN5_9PLEO|nr:unnamed protein product [Periconia digitata]